ncbi:MAG: hypothetical protein LBV50_11380 [Novosphingobium sp.]|nr:hypothetical protein [Novosphingobium sp.]
MKRGPGPTILWVTAETWRRMDGRHWIGGRVRAATANDGFHAGPHSTGKRHDDA